MYATSDDVERLNERLGLERLKETVLDAGLVKDTKAAQRSGAKVTLDDLLKKQVGEVEQKASNRPGQQRSGAEVKLDALLKEHQEQKQAKLAVAKMSESERKARQLLEVFELARGQKAKPVLPVAQPVQRERVRQGMDR